MFQVLSNQHYQHRTNQKLRSRANAVFQNRGVCGQAVPSFPSPSPVIPFFALVPTFLDELARKRLLRRLHQKDLKIQCATLCRTADLLVTKGNSAVKCSQNYDKTDSKLRFGIVMIFVRCLSTGNSGSVFVSRTGFI